MKKINWAEKLTSRKFWTAVAGFVGPLLLAFGVADDMVTQVVGLIMAGAAVVAYILGEGLVDAKRSEVIEGVEVIELESADETGAE